MPSLDDVLQRYRDYGQQTQAPLPPPALQTRAGPPAVPQYQTPNAFQVPPGSVSMFQPPEPMGGQGAYEAQVAQRFTSQMHAYQDPASTWHMRSRAGKRFGAEYGGAVGTGVSMLPLPGALPAGIGIGLFGEEIGGVVGGAADWAGDLVTGQLGRRSRQAQHMHQATSLQAATQGHLMLGQEEAGLGGQGMNLQTASRVAQKLTNVGRQQDVSREDMTSLTRAAGQLNFLDQVTDADQIVEVVEKLSKVVGAMGRITGDPSIMNNLREIADLRRAGLNIDQAVQATEQIGMAARGMGVSRAQAMASAGAMGAGMFQQAGLTRGAGLTQGVGAAALARMGAAGLDERQLALAGGTEGLATTFMQQNLRFAQGPGNLMMLSGLQQRGGGELGLQAGFGQQLTEGGSFTDRLRKGVGNIGSPGQLVQFMGQQRELQSEMMEQLGPFGAQLGQARLIEDLAKQMPGDSQRERTMMAASMVTGSPEKGLELMRTLGSEEFQERAGGFIEEEQRRARFTGAQERVQAREARQQARRERQFEKIRPLLPGAGLREAASAVGGAIWGEGTVAELEEAAYEEQKEQDEIADEMFEEMTGLERTTRRARESLILQPVERERKRAEKMREAGWEVSGLSRTGSELGGAGAEIDVDEETGRIRVRGGERRRIQSASSRAGAALSFGLGVGTPFEVQSGRALLGAEKTAADIFLGDTALTAGITGGLFEDDQEIREQRQRALKTLRRTGERIQEFKEAKLKDQQRLHKSMVEKLGPGAVANMRKAVVQYAANLDESGKGIDTDAMFEKMVDAYAEEKGIPRGDAHIILSREREKFERAGIQMVSESTNEKAVAALQRSEDAAAVDVTAMDVDALQEARENAAKKMTRLASRLGFAEKGAESAEDLSPEQLEAFKTFRGLSSEDQALAMGLLAGEEGSEELRDELEQLRADAPERYARVRKAVGKMRGGMDREEYATLQKRAGAETRGASLEDITERLTEGREEGEGVYGAMQVPRVMKAVEDELRKRRGGDELVSRGGEGAGAGTEESQQRTADLQRTREQLERLPEIFGEFPAATQDLREASNSLKEAAEEMQRQKNTPWPE